MKEYAALLTILREYIGINRNCLSRLEINIMEYATKGTGMTMLVNPVTDEYIGPVKPE